MRRHTQRLAVLVFASLCVATRSLLAAPAAPMLLVLNKGDLTLVTVDVATLKVTGRYPSGPAPHEVVASSDGKLAYISNYRLGQELTDYIATGAPDTISVVDLAAKKALPPIELGPLTRPHGLAVAGGKLYFTAEGSKVVARYDPARHAVDWIMGTGQNRTHMLMVSNDLKRIITTNVASGSVSFIEEKPVQGVGRGAPTTDWVVTTVAAGKGSEGYDLSPDGKELWVANAQDQSVSIIDAVSEKLIETVPVPFASANRIKFTLDGRHVLISDLRAPELFVLDAATRKVIKRIDMGGNWGAGMLMDPDGSRAFVSIGDRNGVAVIDLKTLTVSGWIESGPSPDGLAWAVQSQ
jgi:YVTN family beta-propeller protein